MRNLKREREMGRWGDREIRRWGDTKIAECGLRNAESKRNRNGDPQFQIENFKFQIEVPLPTL
jgi:hypothetical protein